MRPDLFWRALGSPAPAAAGALPLVVIDGRPVTLALAGTAEAYGIAARRGTPLVVAASADPIAGVPLAIAGATDPVAGRAGGQRQPWPVVVVAGSPWPLRTADFGLLVGAHGPADHDDLDEEAAAALVRRFLGLSVDAAATPPGAVGSLLDVVPFPVEEPYEIEAVLMAVLDGGSWVELDAGGADEVLTAVGRIAGRSIGIAASRAVVDGGRLGPTGCARVERLLRWCERGDRPFVSLVDTAGVRGADDVDGLESLRQAAAHARRSAVTKVAVVLGRATGLGATVLGAVGARADAVLPWPRAEFALADRPMTVAATAASAMASVSRAARSGDVLEVVHPDDTRSRIAEALDLCRGRREYGR